MKHSVGLALLVVLEKLAPTERVAFVLHDMFDLPFDEIAPIVGRSPTAARQLASRARRRVRGTAAVFSQFRDGQDSRIIDDLSSATFRIPEAKSSAPQLLTVGGRFPKHSSVSQLTSRPDSVLSKCRRSRHPIPTRIATALNSRIIEDLK
jgi:Sigma-70, region 4